MATFTVILGRLVRETKTIQVEAESVDAIDTDKLYENEDGFNWEPDLDWGCEEGTHTVCAAAAPTATAGASTEIARS